MPLHQRTKTKFSGGDPKNKKTPNVFYESDPDVFKPYLDQGYRFSNRPVGDQFIPIAASPTDNTTNRFLLPPLGGAPTQPGTGRDQFLDPLGGLTIGTTVGRPQPIVGGGSAAGIGFTRRPRIKTRRRANR